LKLLIERQNEVVSRKQILETVWGYDIIPATRTIDNFILNFRKYFERNPAEPEFFQAVRGVGYRFVI
jgi:two-component system alkaline phosphatase synthesis response regulator PhoP